MIALKSSQKNGIVRNDELYHSGKSKMLSHAKLSKTLILSQDNKDSSGSV